MGMVLLEGPSVVKVVHGCEQVGWVTASAMV